MEEIRFARLIVDGNPAFVSRDWVLDVETLDDLKHVIKKINAVLIDGVPSDDIIMSCVAFLRSNKDTCLFPVFCSDSVEGGALSVLDGVVTSWNEARSMSADILSRKADVNLEAVRDDRDFALLSYMYTRLKELKPVLRHFTDEVYVYPVANFIGGEESSAQWLRSLKDRGLLAYGSLVDRIRRCPRCESSHLNYVDTCPDCGSIDIVSKEFIHCFTCGRVAPSGDFLIEHRLQCPFCGTRLRHLGSDYDHPLESFLCNDCGSQFVEPDVVVDCFSCRHRSIPDELTVESIHSYRITEKGKNAARVGNIDDVYSLLDSLNYVLPAYFDQLLDWLILLNRRYPDNSFALMGFSFVNLAELSDALGRKATARMMNTVAERLREILRSTDITTRTTTGTLWILLPRTDLAGIDVLKERILALADIKLPGRGNLVPEFRVAGFLAPEELTEEDTASLIIAKVANRLDF